MSNVDQAELDWWRTFALRFGPGSLPRVGEALCGYHLAVCVERDGDFVRWADRRKK